MLFLTVCPTFPGEHCKNIDLPVILWCTVRKFGKWGLNIDFVHGTKCQTRPVVLVYYICCRHFIILFTVHQI